MLRIGGDAYDTVVHQGLHREGQGLDGLEQFIEDDGLKSVQFQLTCLRSHGDGHVIADDIEAYLVHHLRDNRVHLAGHDGRTVLLCGQVDLAEACLGAGGHQAQVIGHF